MSSIETVESAARVAREAAAGLAQAREERDKAIRDARASGATVTAIARAAGVARTTAHAALRAASGVAVDGDPLAHVARAALAWREADAAHNAANAELNKAVARGMDDGGVSAAQVEAVTGWTAARPYQARDLGRALLAGDANGPAA